MKRKGRIFRRMTGREIRQNWLQFLSMIAITLLAVTLFCGFLSNTMTLTKAVNNFYDETNLCDICVQTYTLSDGERDHLDGLEDGTVQYRFYAEGTINGAGAKIYAAEFSGKDDEISKPIMTDGDTSGAVLQTMSESYATGTPITLTLPYSVGGYDLTLEFETVISGHMQFPESSSDAYTIMVYLSADVLQSLLEENPLTRGISVDSLYNQALFKTDDPDTLKSEISAWYAESDYTDNLLFIYDRSTIEMSAMLDSEISQSTKMIYVFPVIFVIVSVFVILTTVDRLILEDRTEIGTLKALGFTKGDILTHYASIGSILCLIGGVLGAVIGPFVVPSVMKYKYAIVYGLSFPALPSVSIWASVVAVLVIVVLAAVISIAVCTGVANLQPADSMRPVPPDNEKKEKKKNRKKAEATGAGTAMQGIYAGTAMNLTASAGDIAVRDEIPDDVPEKAGKGQRKRERKEKKESGGINGGRFLSLKMASRNIMIKPFRALVTVLGVTGCVALCVCAFGIGDTIDHSLDLELYEQFSWDISVSYENADFAGAAAEIEGVEKIETYTVYYMTATSNSASKDISVYNLPEGMEMTTIDTSCGNVVLSKSLADSMDVGVGDTVTLSSGSFSGTYTISEIVKTAVTKAIFLHSDEMAEAGLYGTNSAWIKVADGYDADSLVDAVNAAAGTSQAVSISQRADDIDEMISSVSTMEITLMIFAILLSVVVVYNLSLLNIRERTRDIATMKVLGITSWKIELSLLYEIMILTLIGTVVGLCLGFPVTYLVMSINTVELMSYMYFVSPLSYLYAALISVAAALIINLLFSRSIPKINMTESLKSVE